VARSLPGIGPRRLVVGAHYGLGGFLGHRLTAVVLAAWALMVGISLLFGFPTYETWSASYAPLWMKVATLVAFGCLLYHAWIGMRDIWMDYVQIVWLRLSLLVLSGLWLLGCAVWCVQILWRV